MGRPGKILVYGFGNPGLRDDGLGNAYVEAVEKWSKMQGLTHLRFDSNYQLNIEDADNIAGVEYVLFVDASQEDISDVKLTSVVPSGRVEYTMHSVSPGFVVELCNRIYADPPKAFLLHIKGYEWELKEGLTPSAKDNLDKAIALTLPMLRDPAMFEERLDLLVPGS